jgi:hypothetical protein
VDRASGECQLCVCVARHGGECSCAYLSRRIRPGTSLGPGIWPRSGPLHLPTLTGSYLLRCFFMWCFVGEYFGVTASVSCGYSSDKRNSRMLLCCLLNVVERTRIPSFAYVVRNPTDWSLSYCLPLAVVSFGNVTTAPRFAHPERKLPPPPVAFSGTGSAGSAGLAASHDVAAPARSAGFAASAQADLKQQVRYVAPFRWYWSDDSKLRPYADAFNQLIEQHYDAYRHAHGPSQFTTPPIVRFVDDKPQPYHIDFKTMRQINPKTSFARAIQRNAADVDMKSDHAWEYRDDTGRWRPFEQLSIDAIEKSWTSYVMMIGPGSLHVTFPGRPERYVLDFVNGLQTNAQSGVVRAIRRVPVAFAPLASRLPTALPVASPAASASASISGFVPASAAASQPEETTSGSGCVIS